MVKKIGKKIRVPKVRVSSAYNPGRPASSLLKSQVRVLQEAVLATIRTEGEASAQIEALTATLHALRPQTAPRAHRSALRRRKKKRS